MCRAVAGTDDTRTDPAEPSNLTDADDVTLAVENEFTANPGAFSAEDPLTIFGYSQSATAESIAMTQLAEDGIPSADLHFVFIGDPPSTAWAESGGGSGLGTQPRAGRHCSQSSRHGQRLERDAR